jgi:hypothetical protein
VHAVRMVDGGCSVAWVRSGVPFWRILID